MSAVLTLSRAQAQAVWAHKAHLDGALTDPVAACAAAGWARTLGGVDAWVALRARAGALRRQAVDQALLDGRLAVVPAVRGCIYLVPGAQAALAIRVAEDAERGRMDRELAKVGLAEAELVAVADAALANLARGPMGTDALKKALPAGLLRPLVEVGKKVGISSALPPTLRRLEWAGKIQRVLADGRLDSERYLWRVTSGGGSGVPDSASARLDAVVAYALSVSGPLGLEPLAEWTGVGKRALQASLKTLQAVVVSVSDVEPEAYVLPDDLPLLRDPPPPPARPRFFGFEETLVLLHGGPAAVTDPRHHALPVVPWGARGNTVPLREARHRSTRTITAGGRLVGLWEYDPDQGRVVTATFDPGDRTDAIAEEAGYLSAFLRDEVGHARSFSLDSEDGMRERCAWLRGLGVAQT